MSAKFVDVDGHILEPPDLWEEYLEPRYRDRAMKIVKDEEGLEYLSIDGKKSFFLQGGTLAAVAAIGQDVKPFLTPGKIDYKDAILPGGIDPHERIKVMDEEGIDATLIYPSVGLSWEVNCEDSKLAAAYCRAYNNWMFDFCKPYPDRLVPVAHIPMRDVEESVKELKRTAKLGAKAAMIYSESPGQRPYGSTYYDPLWAEAQDLDIPITIHPAVGGENSVPNVLYPTRDVPAWWFFVTGGDDVKLQFTTFFNEGTFDRFPRLKVVVLEAGCGWIAHWIYRMDEKYEVNGFTTPMKLKPSEYFQRQCWISMDPDESLAPLMIERLGADKFLWAYDYPHSDSGTNPVKELKETLKPLPEDAQRKVFGENAMELYHLGR